MKKKAVLISGICIFVTSAIALFLYSEQRNKENYEKTKYLCEMITNEMTPYEIKGIVLGANIKDSSIVKEDYAKIGAGLCFCGIAFTNNYVSSVSDVTCHH